MVRHNGIPTFDEMKEYFGDSNKAFECLLGNDVFDVPDTCGRCGQPVKLNPKAKSSEHRVRCGRKSCTSHPDGRWSTSVLSGTFFMDARVPINELLHFLWMFAIGTTNNAVMATFGWSSAAVCEWIRFAQQPVAEIALQDAENFQMGGPGVAVQVDESKFGKRKHNRGHRVEGAWAFGGVEETDERRCFLMELPEVGGQTRVVLEGMIKKFILPGSTLITDGLKSYNHIKEIPGYFCDHKVAVHEKECANKDLDNTNMIEGTWSGVKSVVPKRKRARTVIQGCLHEFMWRRMNAGRLWAAMLEALRKTRHI